jgi:hypothetical protein
MQIAQLADHPHPPDAFFEQHAEAGQHLAD